MPSRRRGGLSHSPGRDASHPPPSTASPSAWRSTTGPGCSGRVASAIGEAGGVIGAVDLVEVDERLHRPRHHRRRRRARSTGTRSSPRSTRVDGARVIDTTDRTFLLHVGGKIEQHNKHPLKTRDDLSMAYTPGVARVCEAIAEDPDKAFQYTIKRNTVAVVTDGTAVLGLGDIGPRRRCR